MDIRNFHRTDPRFCNHLNSNWVDLMWPSCTAHTRTSYTMVKYANVRHTFILHAKSSVILVHCRCSNPFRYSWCGFRNRKIIIIGYKVYNSLEQEIWYSMMRCSSSMIIILNNGIWYESTLLNSNLNWSLAWRRGLVASGPYCAASASLFHHSVGVQARHSTHCLPASTNCMTCDKQIFFSLLEFIVI